MLCIKAIIQYSNKLAYPLSNGDMQQLMEHTQAYITVQSVSKQFNQAGAIIPVLRSVSVTFEQGKTYAIMGISGSGKSTLLQLIAGLDMPTKGIIFWNGQDTRNFTLEQCTAFLNKSIGLLFQFPYLIKELSVLENVILPGLIAGENFEICKKKAEELLCTVGLSDKIHAKPGSLSGGEQQRVALARAIENTPLFLLADEPTGNLDSHTGSKMIELLLQLRSKKNMGIIMSTHDTALAFSMDVVYELQDGHLIHKQ